MKSIEAIKGIRIVSLLGWTLFALSMVFPDYLWGVNHIAFLPVRVSIPLLLVSFALVVAPESAWRKLPLPSSNWFLRLGLSVSVAVFFWFFPIPADYYGDAVFVKPAVDFEIPEWDDRLTEGVFEFDILNTKSGLQTYYQLNNFGSWLFGVNGTIITRAFELVLVVLFLMLWMSICKALFPNSKLWFWGFGLVGFSSPLLVSFMGHYEYYFLPYTAIMWWFYLLVKYFVQDKRWVLYVLPFAFLLLLQTHVTCWLLSPTLAFPYLKLFETRFDFLKKLNTKSGMKLLYGGTFLLGLFVAYFFIYQNYNGPRYFSKNEFEDSLFLPLYTDEVAPLDRYNLFSMSHFIDYANLSLLWFGPVVVFWFLLTRLKTDSTDSNGSFLQLLELVTGIYLLAFFMFNPLLGATLDWDLFVLPALVFLVTIAAKVSFNQSSLKASAFTGPIVGLSLLGATVFPVHASNETLANRYKCLGIYHYKTYWQGSSTVLRGAAEMLSENPEQEQKEMIEILNAISPFAIETNDLEYAGVLHHLGLLSKREGDYTTAYNWFNQASEYHYEYGTNLYQLTIVCFELKRYDEALKHASRLVELRYQPLQRTVRMAIHIALAANRYQDAANLSVFYLKKWPDDQHIAEVEYRLRNGLDIESIITTFNNSAIDE